MQLLPDSPLRLLPIQTTVVCPPADSGKQAPAGSALPLALAVVLPDLPVAAI